MTTFPTLKLDKLHAIMNQGGITDDDIIAGVQLSREGYRKAAGQMGLRGHEGVVMIGQMINQLIEKLRQDQSLVAEAYRDFISEDEDQRYSIEDDFLGNITIRDAETGDETYLQGSEAAELMTALSHTGDKQSLLAHYMVDDHVRESLDEEDEQESSFESEIDGAVGTYNFPWKFSGRHGTGTVEYSAKGKEPIIKLVSIRDDEGDEIDVSGHFAEELKKQAIAFIGDA